MLLFGLFCVAGNIALEGDLVGTPKVNIFDASYRYAFVELDWYDRSKYAYDKTYNQSK